MPQVDVGDGIALYYELYDFTEPWKAGPPPILFLHGLGGDRRMWNDQVPVFSGQYPTLVVDLRGHGRSTRPAADFTVADMARDVLRLTRTVGIERAHVVGLSMGGVVAQQLALEFPPVIASLVLCDTFSAIPAELAPMARETLAFIETHDMSEVARTRISLAFSDHADPAMREYWIEQVAKNDKETYLRAARATFAFSSQGRLSALRVPALVVVGEEDRVTPPPLAHELAQQIAGAKLATIPRAGHISNAENPEAFNRRLAEFLAAVSPRW